MVLAEALRELHHPLGEEIQVGHRHQEPQGVGLGATDDPHQGHDVEAGNQSVPEGLSSFGVEPGGSTGGNRSEEDDEDDALIDIHVEEELLLQHRRCT